MSSTAQSKTIAAADVSGASAANGFDQAAATLCEIGREFYRRGWVFGTSGNFSTRLSESPLRLAITSSGLDKGSLTPSDILEIDSDATVLRGNGRPSAETRLHLVIVQELGAGVSPAHAFRRRHSPLRPLGHGKGTRTRRLRNAQGTRRHLDPRASRVGPHPRKFAGLHGPFC